MMLRLMLPLAVSMLAVSPVLAQFGPLVESAPNRGELPIVEGNRQMVAAAHPLAAAAGKEMLDAGGSAMDAVIAMQLVLTLVEPQSSGIGGGGFVLGRSGRSGDIASLDGRESAPAWVTQNLFLQTDGKPVAMIDAFQGGRSVGVPGMVAMMAKAHKSQGRLPWQRLFAPAIRHARDGFAVTPRLAGMISNAQALMKNFPETQRYFSRADGTPLQAGDVLRNPAYAAFLKRLAREGARAFYSGSNAKAIASAASASPVSPANLTTQDLQRYRVEPRKALCGPYRQWTLCSMGPPSSGATTMLAALGQLERFDLAAMGPQSADAIHLIAESLAVAFADREKYLADPGFVPVPASGLIDPAYLAARSALIDPARAGGPYSAGEPPRGDKIAWGNGAHIDVPSTSHMVAADRLGGVASWTGTVQAPFGSFLMVNGYLLNNELTDFAFTPERDGVPVANRAQPGKRPRSSMTPTLVLDKDGRLVAALGSAGGSRIIAHVMKTLIAHLDWGLPMQRAIDYPNFFKTGQGLEIEPGPVATTVRPGLEAKGHKIIERPNVSGVQGIAVTPRGFSGGADPRREGIVLSD
jgi:gamma-glutamyltranspeptidase / glutathione hydrolase